MSTGIQPPSARLSFFTAGLLYYFESNSYSICDTYAVGIQGPDLSQPSVLFWHCHQKGAWNKLATATISWLSFIPSTLSNLALLSQSLGNRWKAAPGFLLGLWSQLVTYVQAYCVLLDRTSTLHILSLTSRSPAYHLGHLNWVIGNWYSCTRVSKCPPAAKEQPDVTSYIPCILLLVCKWSINLGIFTPWDNYFLLGHNEQSVL